MNPPDTPAVPGTPGPLGHTVTCPHCPGEHLHQHYDRAHCPRTVRAYHVVAPAQNGDAA